MNAQRVPRVLVADDDHEHGEAIAKTFARAGYGVTTAGDGYEALRALADRHFDLVITDLSMPRMNGLELLQSIRALSPHLPVLIMTAFGEWTTYVQAMDRGCVDYLSKPVRRTDLLMVARKALARRGIRPPDTGIPEAGGELVEPHRGRP